MDRLLRLRVPLGFVCGAIAFWLARPTSTSIAIGMLVGAVGESIRLWASGHIDKGREITRSGPYRFARHPLYVGSAILGIGFMIAARSLPAAIVVSLYLIVVLVAAARSEEAVLERRFSGEYSAYREGRATPVDRPFTMARLRANREYRAVLGLILGGALLYLRSRL
jgi:protein-S-isoprenylcysteine O-methyltransferase Ste14